MAETEETQGRRNLNSGSNQYNALNFFVEQSLREVNTAEFVRVVQVNEETVNVLPIISDTSGDGSPVEPDIIPEIPYLKLQGGTNGIICDPVINDIGLCVYCQRDTTSAKTNKGEATPQTDRMFNPADGVYIGLLSLFGLLPTRFIKFEDGKITINGNELLDIIANTTIDGTLGVTGATAIDNDLTVATRITAPVVKATTAMTGALIDSGGKTLAIVRDGIVYPPE